ncbi:hypothetical protein SporoP8_01575 [Sporosarcina ureae]|nr:hypothetical protein SporoP8_01575 [Sporosarcina ureae]
MKLFSRYSEPKFKKLTHKKLYERLSCKLMPALAPSRTLEVATSLMKVLGPDTILNCVRA